MRKQKRVQSAAISDSRPVASSSGNELSHILLAAHKQLIKGHSDFINPDAFPYKMSRTQASYMAHLLWDLECDLDDFPQIERELMDLILALIVQMAQAEEQQERLELEGHLYMLIKLQRFFTQLMIPNCSYNHLKALYETDSK